MNKETTFGSLLREFSDKENCQLDHSFDEYTLTVNATDVIAVMTALRDNKEFLFDQLIDVAGVDYLEYGKDEWKTKQATDSGFSRGISKNTFGRFTFDNNPITNDMDQPRFAVTYHLLSVANNRRLRVKAYCDDNDFPVIESVCDIWNSANWFEREAFDLYGIIFQGHPDMRRLLTDYGFVGHPLRKDFPLVGHVEMRFDPSKKRVVYEPVSIEPRVLVPKVIREDNRYQSGAEKEAEE